MMGTEQLDAPPVFVLNNNFIEVYFTFHKIYPFKVYILVLFGIFRYIWYIQRDIYIYIYISLSDIFGCNHQLYLIKLHHS